MQPSEKLNKNHYDNLQKEKSKMKTQNHDLQFYITRYPFPNKAIIFQTKFYKTFYQCIGFQLNNDKILRLTGLNRLTSLIKLKQIVKSITKPNQMKNEKSDSIFVHSYSLYYEIVPNFILSQAGISIIKSLSSQEIKSLFENVILDIDLLIASRIFYLLDVQNIAISMTGKVKIYIPANNIIENIVFTDKQKKQMKLAANKVISCLQRHIQNCVFSNSKIDVQSVKTEIKKQLQSLQINSKNIESQIFTFNQNYQSQTENNIQLQTQHNKNLQKTSKIRKSSQEITFLPKINIQSFQNGFKMEKQKGNHLKCVTAREYIKKQEQKDQKNDPTKNISFNSFKSSDAFKQKMKDYQMKLQTLDHTVKKIKEQMGEVIKKDNNQKQKKQKIYHHDRFRSKTYANLPYIKTQQPNDIDQIVQKLSSSRLQIKKLLLDETHLRHSYHLSQEQEKKKNQQFELKRQIQNLLGCTFSQSLNESKKPKILSPSKNKEKDSLHLPIHTIKQFLEPSKLDEIKQQKSNSKNQKIKKSPDSFNQESSWGKLSPPGGNPFRQYGNFRIQYVIDDQAIPNMEKNYANEIGQIKIYHQLNVEPFRQKLNSKKQHYLTPLSHLQQNFRYSSLALQKDLKGQFLRISIPENIYDPTQYDSMDTFQMEIGRDDKMPRIVSKAAFRHTLFPSPIFGIVKPTKDVQKSQQNIVLMKQQKSSKNDRNYKSVDRKTYKKQTNIVNDNLSQKRSKIQEQIVPQIIIRIAATQVSKDVNNSLIVPKKVQVQSLTFGMIQQKRQKGSIKSRRQSQYERLSKTNKDVPRFMNIDMSPDKDSCKNLKELQSKISPQGNKKTFDKQKIKAILNRSKQIITKYKNFPTRKQ